MPQKTVKPWFTRAQLAGLALSAGACALSSGWALASEPQAFTIAQEPLFLASPAPNVLLLLDTSNSFDERPDGMPVGSNHKTSKSVIARAALSGIVDDYQGKINLGLMSYKLGAITPANLTPSGYDASYDPSSYDPTFTSAKASANSWESFPYIGWPATVYSGRYTTPMVCAAPYSCPWSIPQPYSYMGLSWTDSPLTSERRGLKSQFQNLANTSAWYLHPYDFVYYNVAQADYSTKSLPNAGPGAPPPYFCYGQNTLGLHGASSNHPANTDANTYTCSFTKNPPSSGNKPDGEHTAQGVINYPTYGGGGAGPFGFNPAFNSRITASDSDQAQGFTTFGRALVDFGNTLASAGAPAAPSYSQDNAPGWGTLNAAIQPLSAAQAAKLKSKLTCNIPGTWAGGAVYTPDPSITTPCYATGLINAGATPSPGALQSAKHYLSGSLQDRENDTGESTATLNTQGTATNNFPVSCGKNYVIFVTDGMPSHDPNGNLYASPAAALADTIAAASALKTAGSLVYVIGFGAEVQQSGLDKIADAGGTGVSLVADDGAALNAALSYVFNDVIVRSSSAASVATNSSQFSVDTAIYQARFTSLDWSGQLLKYQTNNTTGAVAASADWDAALSLNAQVAPGNGNGWSSGSSNLDRRQIAVGRKPGSGDPYGDTVGVPFAWPANPFFTTSKDMAGWQLLALSKDQLGSLDLKGASRVGWLRGDQSNEGTSSGDFRARATSVLGDIVDSFPLYVGPPASKASGVGYGAFRALYANRRPVIIAGANDGMIHLFDTSNGKEIFAYIPSTGFLSNPASNSAGSRLSQLMRQDYKSNHMYLVNGAPVTEDVYYGAAWHTVMVMGAAAGGQGYSALNITNTSNDAAKPDPVLTEAKASQVALWEFTDRNTNSGSLSSNGDPSGIVNGDKDLGYAYSKPWIGMANNGKWVAIFGNGYNNTEADGSASSSGNAALYVVDISNGHLIKKIKVPEGTPAIPNGLGAPRALDARLSGKADFVYAGDLYGNIWKFDLTSTDPTDWALSYSGKPLFTVNAIGGGTTGVRRPITGELRISPNPSGGYMVMFGTGRYIATTAVETPGVYDSSSLDALYSIWDMETESTVIKGASGNSRSWLTPQSLQYATASGGSVYRQLTSTASTACQYGNTPATQPGCAMGCYVDLKNYPNPNYNGERFTYFPQLTAGAVSFNTIIPSANACSGGGDSEEIIFNYLTCTSGAASNFDVNGDQVFNTSDLISFNGGVGSAAGAKILSGITPPGTRVNNPATGQVFVYNSSSLGGNPTQDRLRFDANSGRVSWREVKPQP